MPDDPPQAAAVLLCPADTLQERGPAFGFDLLQYGRPVRGFVLRFDGQLLGYLNRCVHVPMEMDWQAGQFLDSTQRWILCSTHGATYEPVSGRCVAGPCGRGQLTRLTVQERAGHVYWYPSQELRPVFSE